MINSSDPNQPVQNYEIVNPTLEQQVANLLPSVAGYGGNLRSTNTIIPIVDLTSAAEGTTLPESLQRAIAFGSQTAFNVSNTTTVLANSPGWYRIFGTLSIRNSASATQNPHFSMSDGVSTKIIWGCRQTTASDINHVVPFDYDVWLSTGESISAVSDDSLNVFIGSTRQLATSTGTLVDPAGFPI